MKVRTNFERGKSTLGAIPLSGCAGSFLLLRTRLMVRFLSALGAFKWEMNAETFPGDVGAHEISSWSKNLESSTTTPYLGLQNKSHCRVKLFYLFQYTAGQHFDPSRSGIHRAYKQANESTSHPPYKQRQCKGKIHIHLCIYTSK